MRLFHDGPRANAIGALQALPAELAVWIILEGQGVITVERHGPTAFARGDTLLLPATMKNAHVRTIADCSWLEARIPAEIGKM